MHKVFGNERGFEDKELRTIQSTIKHRTVGEPPLLEPEEASGRERPSARAKQEEAA